MWGGRSDRERRRRARRGGSPPRGPGGTSMPVAKSRRDRRRRPRPEELGGRRHDLGRPRTRPGRGQAVSTTRPDRDSVITADAHVGAAEGDVRGGVARDGIDVEVLAVRCDDHDAVGDGPDHDATVRFDREGVEGEWCRRETRPAVPDGKRAGGGPHLTGTLEIPGPQPAGVGLRDVHPAPFGRQPHAVRPEEGKRDLADGRPIGWHVVEPAPVDAGVPPLAVVGEPQAADLVEHQVVRTSQGAAITLSVQHADLARAQVDSFQPTPGEAGRLVGVRGPVDWDPHAPRDLAPEEAAIVGDDPRRGCLEGQPVGPPPGVATTSTPSSRMRRTRPPSMSTA